MTNSFVTETEYEWLCCIQ